MQSTTVGVQRHTERGREHGSGGRPKRGRRLATADRAALCFLALAALLGVLGVVARLRDLDAVAFVGGVCVVLMLVHIVWNSSAPLLAGPSRRTGRAGASDLERALGAEGLELCYQPQTTRAGRTAGMEALLRHRGRDGRREPPGPLIEEAERAGLMPRLTQFVLDTAVAQAAAWRREGLAVPVAVNVSPTDALVPGFPAEVRDCLRRNDLPGDALTIELTESAETRDVRALAEALADLRRQGVRVSLDDFGTGHSSIARLRELPVDELKIDRSFVSRMSADPKDEAVVRCSVDLARSLGLDVVAEGVETEEVRGLLEGMGVSVIQGWLVAPALSAADATGWLRRTAAPGCA
ncbi:EAL domain-containing protein [Streptomyces sp. NBC_01264]|uniref:EAL domain-containing protein n=1 Tax=Streptomyces sp. NBC_01264 TaxID=2903804 RepID=UPI00225044F7|nr:EAL domain-containing protein [Streptomyces sp. NBC_01264]MCX4781826.1 EAL domain-containing protein [Streptomyces sp. NBC_01264]